MRIKWALAGIVLLIMCAVIVAGALDIYSLPVLNKSDDKIIVVIDPGHGARDSGKTGVNGVLEKDINLTIALMLKEELEAQGIEVIMTRSDDLPLYSENASNKKREDMNRRIQIIEESNADFVISIHQNSYPQESAKGAQVFYYNGSAESQKLAEIVQSQLITGLDPSNKRQAKANSDYFLLKKTKVPCIICECAFLSNPEESNLITDPSYQKKAAQSICAGVLEYLGITATATETPSTEGLQSQ